MNRAKHTRIAAHGAARALAALVCALGIAAGNVTAQDIGSGAAPALPLWELGVGAVGRISPDYPAADSYNRTISPLPFVIYRGRVFEFGGDATARIIPFRTDRFEIGVTVDGSSGVDSGDNALRGALPDPDLDALAEFGPELVYRGLSTPALLGGGTGRWDITLQTRGAFSVGGGDIVYEGMLVRPTVRYLQRDSLAPGSRILASIGPVFATEGVHDFFYEVDANGPGSGYDARGGYLGTELGLSVRYPLTNRLQLIGGVGLSVHTGAANRKSPLFANDMNGSAFVGLTFSFLHSRRLADPDR